MITFSDIIPWIPSILLFGFTYFIMIASERDTELEDGAHETASGRARKKDRGPFLNIFGGFVAIFGAMASTLPFDKRRERLRKKLTQAGNPGDLSPDDFDGARVVVVILFVVLGSLVDWLAYTPGLFVVVGGLLGVVYPDLWVSGAIQKRKRRVFRDLPDMLDSLRLAVDAGLDLSTALKVVCEQGKKGPLHDELEKVEREIALGRTRKEAFRNFSDRMGMTEINSFVLALMQADQLGASVGPILKVQGEMARTRRWQLAEALVNKMPMKMLGPLVVFIFPASFIILFTPLVIQWMQSD